MLDAAVAAARGQPPVPDVAVVLLCVAVAPQATAAVCAAWLAAATYPCCYVPAAASCCLVLLVISFMHAMGDVLAVPLDACIQLLVASCFVLCIGSCLATVREKKS